MASKGRVRSLSGNCKLSTGPTNGIRRESINILKQALDQIPAGEIQTGKKNYQVRVPKGDVYGRAENPKGELGFYFVSDGTGKPYRMRVRAPSFVHASVLPRLCQGGLIADVIANIGTIDIVLGECDR